MDKQFGVNPLGGVRELVNRITTWQEQKKKEHEEEQRVHNSATADVLFETGLKATDEVSKKKNLTGANAINVGNIIIQAAKDHGSTGYNELLPEQAISKYMDKNPDKVNITNQAIAGTVDLDTWAKAIGAYVDEYDPTEGGLYEAYAPVNESSNVGGSALLLGGGTALLGGATEFVDRVVNPYSWSFDINEDEARSIQRDKANAIELKKYDKLIKEQEKVLNKAIKNNEGVEQAEAKLNYLKTAREKIYNDMQTTTRKTVDTAADYNLWGWDKANIGDKAKAKGELMFQTEIIPALQNSKQTVNIQELIDSIDVEELAKGDPDKLSAYSDALEDLKTSFSDPKYAEYPMMDTQTLKSGLQGRTPQKFYKGKEITNELQELKGILGSKIKNELHSKLSAEMGVNTATKYLDYANLMDIARAGVKDRASSKSKGGFGGFVNFVKDKIVGAASGPSLLIKNTRKLFEYIPSKISEASKEILNNIKDNPKQVISKGVKGLKELLKMDVMVLAPDLREIANPYELSLGLINDRLNGEGLFKGKSDDEMENILSLQTIVDSLQNEEFLKFLYDKGIDVEELEKNLTK